MTEAGEGDDMDLDAIRADLEYASSGIDGGDQQYHPHALTAMRVAEKLLAEVERLKTWPGLMETLAELYPPHVFDGSSGDPGPQILSLTRRIAELEAKLAEAEQRRVLIMKRPGFGRRNVHCSNCGDERGGMFGHEISECKYRHGMTAEEVAQILPEHLRAKFWEQAVERYLLNDELGELDALALADSSSQASAAGGSETRPGVETPGDARCNHLFDHPGLGTMQCVKRRRHIGPHENGSITWTATDHREPDSRAGQTGEEVAGS